MNYIYITGTSRGIGKAIAEALLADKNNLVFGISRDSSLQAENYFHEHLDLSQVSSVADFEFKKHKDAKKIVLINNAATLGEMKHIGALNNETIIHAFNVNIIAPALLMNQFIHRYQQETCDRLIINLTSGAAQSPYDGWSLYCSGKSAIDMLSKVGAVEQEMKGNHGIRLFAVAPGVVNTDMQTTIRNTDVIGFSRKQKFIELHTENQLYAPEAVAKAFVRIIQEPEKVKEVVSRISL